MADTISGDEQSPEIFVGGEITQDAQGKYRAFTTASVRSRDPIEVVEDLFREALMMADTVTQDEIVRRKQRDEGMP